MNLADFLDRFGPAIAEAVIRTYPPLYDAEVRRTCNFDVRHVLRRPIGAQADAIRATTLSLQQQPGTIVVGEMGVGKASPLDTPVLTPCGWKRMGDIQVGDRVIGSDGRPTEVVGVYPQGERPIYRVTCSDGASVECDEEHLWQVQMPLRKWRGRPSRVLTTRQITQGRLRHANGNLQVLIPLVRPVQFDDPGGRPLDPYLLGVLLGDGGLTQNTLGFSSASPAMVAALPALLPPGTELVRKGGCDYRFRGPALLREVERLGLAGHASANKFIPNTYLRAPVEDRIALLQGLLDTDGCAAGKLGTCIEYVTVSKRLAQGVVEIVRSLGGVARMTTQEPSYVHNGEQRRGQLAYRVVISLPAGILPFRLPEKAVRYRPLTKYQPTRAIVSIEPVGTKAAQCIKVAAHDHLYVTDGYIVTHNTTVAAAAAYLAGFRRVFVLVPPHLVKKWQREVLQTVPGARATIVRRIGDLERVRQVGGGTQFVICSREQAKLGYRWIPAAVLRPARDELGGLVRNEAGQIVRLVCCPTCFAPVADEEQVPLRMEDLEAKKRRCLSCGGPLWQADRTGPRRFPLADYIRHRMAGYFDLLIVDEVHEYKARGSAQGLAAGTLAAVCGKALTLTGTIFGGYSSTLFYLLWRFSPAVRLEFGYREEAKWVGRYGIIERITKKDPDAYADDGRHSKRRGYLTRTVEKPGVSPAVLFHLIGNTVFLRLADVAQSLPTYTERVALFPLEAGSGGEEPSQASCYRRLAGDLWQAVAAALQQGLKRLLSTYLQALLAYPDACTKGETVVDHETGSVIAHVPALPAEMLYPKERALVELVRRERARGRRVLVFITHTESRDISPRLRLILEPEGFRVSVLKAGTVSADRREEWVAARVREGTDVLICHPRLVQTGLDLVDWPSVVWFEPEYSVYVLRQASRRSWRIGQRHPVEVTYLVYEGTLQAEALALVAAKMRSSLMIEGELPEDGLAALEGDGQDVFLALARRLTERSSGEGQSLEALFAQTRAIEAEAEDYLVDGEWGIPETLLAPMLAPSLPVPRGDAAELWQRVFNGGTRAESRPSERLTPRTNGRVVTFEELASLVRRPKPRRKLVAEGQLLLFDG